MELNDYYLKAIRQGNEIAISELYEKQKAHQIPGIANKTRSRPGIESEELFNTSFQAMVQRIKDDAELTLDAEIGAFLWGFINLNIKNAIRRSANHSPEKCSIDETTKSLVSTDSADKSLLLAEMKEGIRKLLGKLAQNCQDVIRLKFLDELSDKEIAQRLGKKYDWVRSHRHKCYLRIRSKFPDELKHLKSLIQ